jgi:hypothetical protein
MSDEADQPRYLWGLIYKGNIKRAAPPSASEKRLETNRNHSSLSGALGRCFVAFFDRDSGVQVLADGEESRSCYFLVGLVAPDLLSLGSPIEAELLVGRTGFVIGSEAVIECPLRPGEVIELDDLAFKGPVLGLFCHEDHKSSAFPRLTK